MDPTLETHDPRNKREASQNHNFYDDINLDSVSLSLELISESYPTCRSERACVEVVLVGI